MVPILSNSPKSHHPSIIPHTVLRCCAFPCSFSGTSISGLLKSTSCIPGLNNSLLDRAPLTSIGSGTLFLIALLAIKSLTGDSGEVIPLPSPFTETGIRLSVNSSSFA